MVADVATGPSADGRAGATGATAGVGATAQGGISELVREFRGFRAEVLESLFQLGVIQFANANPTLVQAGAATTALTSMRKLAEKATAEATVDDGSGAVEIEDGEGVESEDENGDESEDESGDESTVEKGEPTVEALQKTKSESEESEGESGSSSEEASGDEEDESDSGESDDDVEMSAA